MILRRIIENVAARDWFTVTIEFVIVVVGIFVGLDVSNWNEERKFAAQEKACLAQLRDEIVQNNRLVELQTRFIADVLVARQSELEFLEGDGSYGNLRDKPARRSTGKDRFMIRRAACLK